MTVSGLPADFSGTVAVYNSMGQMVAGGWKSGGQFSVEAGHLKPGIYVVQIRSEKGGVATKKFVKNWQ